MGKTAFFVSGLVAAAACLAFAFWNVDLGELGHSLAATDKRGIVPFVLVLFAFYWVKTLRWKWLLAPIKVIPARRLFPSLMVGYGVSMLVPMHLGEVARVLMARSEHGIRASSLLMTIALERLLDLVTIPFLFAVAMTGANELPDGLLRAGYVMGVIGLAGLAFSAAFVLRPRAVMAVAAFVTAPLPSGLKAGILAQLEAAAEGAAALRAPGRVAAIVLLTLLQWTLMWLCAWISIWAIGAQVSWAAALLTVAMINVAVALPTSPGFIGSVQAAFVLALLPFGIDREGAIAASIYFHVLMYGVVVITAVVFLHRAGRSVRSLLRASDAPG